MRFPLPKLRVPPHSLSPEAVRSCVGHLRKVGSARSSGFRLRSVLRASSFNILAGRFLPFFPFLRTSVTASPRWQRLVRFSVRFRSAAFPATPTCSQAVPSRTSANRLWISRISGIESAAPTKPSAIKVLQRRNRSPAPLAGLLPPCKKLWRSLTFLLRMAHVPGGTG